jgi:dynein heavy chain 1
MRFYFDPKQTDTFKQLSIHMANAQFHYGFEYLGVQDRLVQTPLTDRCYLTMTQALESGLGGSPFGPAGTGKTESVKALGHQLGRFVLVFNCDETFDFQAMGRIFVGLCQVIKIRSYFIICFMYTNTFIFFINPGWSMGLF